MSKALRQRVILELLERSSVDSQEDLQRVLSKRGLKVGQATLSRDIRAYQRERVRRIAESGR